MNIYEYIYEYIWIYIWFFWFEHSASTNTCSVEHMNASDKLIDNNWIYYIAGSCFLIHVPKGPTYTRPHLSADIFENGVVSPRFSKKYASIWNVFKSFLPPKVLTRRNKSCVLYWVCAVGWKPSFSSLFSSTHTKTTIWRFQKLDSGDGFWKPCATLFLFEVYSGAPPRAKRARAWTELHS